MGILDMFGVGPIADLASKILDFFPDAAQRAKAAEMLQDFQTKIIEGQNATNAAEATAAGTIGSPAAGLFLAGWRPALGWICVFGFGTSQIYSLAYAILHGLPVDTRVLTSTLWGMLGLGAYRSAEKIGGVATTAIKRLVR